MSGRWRVLTARSVRARSPLSRLRSPLDPPAQGLVGAPACGDVMKLQIQVDGDGTIRDSKFKTFGCGSAIASSSVVTEWVKGKHVDEVLAIKNTEKPEGWLQEFLDNVRCLQELRR